MRYYRNVLLFAIMSIALLLMSFGCTDEKTIYSPEVDHIPPYVWWEAPEGGSTLHDTVTLRLRWFDESNVDSVRFIHNGINISTFPVQGLQDVQDYLWNTHQDSDGVHLWEAHAWDAFLNQGASASLLVRVANDTTSEPREDDTPPVISWLSPTAGDTLEGVAYLQVSALDDDQVDSVRFYISGATPAMFTILNSGDIYYETAWNTDDFTDGTYLIECRAWDRSGNVGFSEPLSVTIWNDHPRVIWVPDDYETIQGAINASRDGDTVRVRAGTYREGLRITYRRLWLESEEGPEETFIIGTGYSSGINAQGELVNLVIRGFTVSADYNGIHCFDGSIVTICNCIIKDDFGSITGIPVGYADAYVYNCIVDGANWGTFVGYNGGCFFNSIFTNCIIGYYQSALCENWVALGWNLFWQNERDYRVACRNDEPQEGDIFENPRFVEGGYSLQGNSPAIDSGNPDLLDKDGSRSDIGVYGGPYAYTQ